MTKELTELNLENPEEVSLVDRGANKRGLPVYKEEKNKMEMDVEIVKAVLETEVDEEKDLDEWIKKAKLSSKGINAVKASLRILSAYKDELPEGVVAKLGDLIGEPSPKKKAKKQDEGEGFPPKKPEEDEMEKGKKVKKGLEALPEEVRNHYDSIFKNQSSQMEAMKTHNEKIEKALKTERDERELSSWISKAEKELEHLPGKTAKELGSDLKAIADLDPKMADTQFEQMKKASDAIAKSELFKVHGGGGGNKLIGGSAMDAIEKMAEGYVEKEAGKLSQEQAVARVLKTKQGKELYSQYLNEHPEQM